MLNYTVYKVIKKYIVFGVFALLILVIYLMGGNYFNPPIIESVKDKDSIDSQNTDIDTKANHHSYMLNEKLTKKMNGILIKTSELNFDSKKMMNSLEKMLHQSQNGKLSSDEMLKLMPEEIACKFKEMVNVITEYNDIK